MRVLLVNPLFPDSYWSGSHALRFARRRCLLPPLGLITVAALLPKEWRCRLIDLNVEQLSDSDIRWADVVMLTGMLVHLGFWPAGNCFCIFYGRTPMSASEDEIVPASPVNLIGTIDNCEALKGRPGNEAIVIRLPG